MNVMQLDGNVNRLLSRVLALHASPKAKQTLDILWFAIFLLLAHLASHLTSPFAIYAGLQPPRW